jgi:hypothetical protein
MLRKGESLEITAEAWPILRVKLGSRLVVSRPVSGLPGWGLD